MLEIFFFPPLLLPPCIEYSEVALFFFFNFETLPPYPLEFSISLAGTARGCLEFRSRTGLCSALWVVEVPDGTKQGLGWAEWPRLYP